MKLTIDHQTLSATKPLAHAVWDEPHDVSAPTHSLGSVSGDVVIDLANGMVQYATITATTNIVLPEVPSGVAEHLRLYLSGNFAVTVQEAGALLDSGTTNTVGNTLVLADSTQAWTTDEFIGDYLHILTGDNAGLSRQITANTATTIVVGVAFPEGITTGINYEVRTLSTLAPFAWLHGEAPELGTGLKLLSFSGTNVHGWTGDGGAA